MALRPVGAAADGAVDGLASWAAIGAAPTASNSVAATGAPAAGLMNRFMTVLLFLPPRPPAAPSGPRHRGRRSPFAACPHRPPADAGCSRRSISPPPLGFRPR